MLWKTGSYIKRGIEVGNIFQLGTKYTKSMNMTYVDSEGNSNYPIMGCYGIGVGRLAASICEAKHDDFGPIWPMAIAPCRYTYAVFVQMMKKQNV